MRRYDSLVLKVFMDEFSLTTLLNVAKFRQISEELENRTGRLLDELIVTDFLTKNQVNILDIEEVLSSIPAKLLEEFPTFICKVNIGESLIPSDVPVIIEKKNFKVSGEVWTIHKNDVDPFPSSPHAHNYDQNLVMHLGNGNLFRKRELISKVKKKKLMALRKLVNNVTLPDLVV